MTIASANPASAGSESAPESISLDDAANLDFRDPEEDNTTAWRPGQQEEEKPVTLEKASETLKSDNPDDEGDEPTETEEAGANEADKAEESTSPDDVPILLKGGEQVKLGELKLGYLREKDYRQKTMALGSKTKSLESSAARVVRTVETIAGFLSQQLPEEPPRQLAFTDPSEYTRQRALFEAGWERVQSVLALAAEPKAVANELTGQDLEDKLASEHAALVQAFPDLEKPEAHQKFFADAFKAGEEMGFTPEELQGFTDHRYLKMAYWALEGLKAAGAKEKAMQKVTNAPPLTAKAKPAAKQAANRDAMRKLNSTGRLQDALSVDF